MSLPVALGAGATVQKKGDLRATRISNAKVFTKGVQAFRERAAEAKNEKLSAEPSNGGGLSRVFVRARPLFEHEVERGEWDCVSPLDGGVAVHEGREGFSVKGVAKKLRNHQFAAAERIDDDDGVYNKLQYLVKQAAAGGMSTLFMYGMTGSGKTYSTEIINRKAPEELFKGGTDMAVELMAYELVGKRAFDLLGGEDPDDSSTPVGAASLKPSPVPSESESAPETALDDTAPQTGVKKEVYLRVGEDGATHVSGSTVVSARTPDGLRELLKRSSERRETSATGTNATSSRSHAVYSMRIHNGGSLTVIDLAGNEGNIETAYHSKEQMKEAAEINSSLMALRSCLQARATGAAHVPFRESVLTRVLRDALLDGASHTAVLACVSPACSHFERTIATMRSAVTLMGILKPAPCTEDILKDPSVQLEGPTKWDSDKLASWVQTLEFAGRVHVPPSTTGASIMKLTAPRLSNLCGCDVVTAKELFKALRVASKEASDRSRALRKDLKSGPQPSTSMDFSKEAPAQPTVAKK